MKKILLVCMLLLPLFSFGKRKHPAPEKTQYDLCDLREEMDNLRDELENDYSDEENYDMLLEFIDNNLYKLSSIKTSQTAAEYKFMLLSYTDLVSRLMSYADNLDKEIDYYNDDEFYSYSEQATSYAEEIEDQVKAISFYGDAKVTCGKSSYYFDAKNSAITYYWFFETEFFCYKQMDNSGDYGTEYLKIAFEALKTGITQINNTGYTGDEKNVAYSNAFWAVKNLGYYNKEGLDYSLRYIEISTSFSSTKTSEIFKNKWLNYKDAAKFIDNIELKDKSLFAGGTVHNQMAEHMKLLSEKDLAIKYTIKSFKNGNNGAYFTKNAIVYLLNNGDKSPELLEMIYHYKSIIDKTNCPAITEVKEFYTRYGDPAGAASLDADYARCLEAAEKEQQRLEKEKKKLEKQQRKAARGGLHVALGTNPIAFFGNDYGINLEFITKKRAIEIGYRGMNDNVEYFVKDVDFKFNGIDTGRYKYSGNRIYLNYKKFIPIRRTSGKAFTGIEVSYTTKEFESMTAVVRNSSTNAVIGNIGFKPSQTQYDAAYIFGLRAARYGVLIEVFSGFGASYKKVTDNSGFYNKSGFTIEDNLLTTRTDGAIALYAKFGYRLAFVF